MNNRQKKILRELVEGRKSEAVSWNTAVAILKALNGVVSNVGGRTRVDLNGTRAIFQKPTILEKVDSGTLSAIRRLIIESGVVNNEI